MVDMEKYLWDKETSEKISETLIKAFEKCAEDSEVYTIDELLMVASHRLVEMAGEIDDAKVLVGAAEVMGAMKQRYSGSRDIDGILGSLVAIYLGRVKERFSREEVR